MTTLTDKAGNPAARIRNEYEALMAIDCPNTLRDRALALVGMGGISEQNAKLFNRTVRKETRLDRLQSFLTNFMLKADGLGVIA